MSYRGGDEVAMGAAAPTCPGTTMKRFCTDETGGPDNDDRTDFTTVETDEMSPELAATTKSDLSKAVSKDSRRNGNDGTSTEQNFASNCHSPAASSSSSAFTETTSDARTTPAGRSSPPPSILGTPASEAGAQDSLPTASTVAKSPLSVRASSCIQGKKC